MKVPGTFLTELLELLGTFLTELLRRQAIMSGTFLEMLEQNYRKSQPPTLPPLPSQNGCGFLRPAVILSGNSQEIS